MPINLSAGCMGSKWKALFISTFASGVPGPVFTISWIASSPVMYDRLHGILLFILNPSGWDLYYQDSMPTLLRCDSFIIAQS